MKQNISLPLKPKIIERENNYAIFEIAPCYPGYGITLGNAFRRVLLSSLSGSAVTAIKVAGVDHDFSKIPGVMEDVIELMLNLKQLRLKIHSEGPIKLLLRVQGEKKVKAKHIQVPSDVEIINKDLHIAELTSKKANLEIEMQAEKGLGYVPVEQKPSDKTKIGTIALDAIFTPIRKVNFTIENMRVGKRTDFNRLLLEIETDGTITPNDAFIEAGKILVEHFKVFTKTEVARAKAKAPAKAKKAVKKAVKSKKTNFKDLFVEDLKISARTIKVLRDNRIKSVASLAKKSVEKLLSLSGMGEKGVKELKRESGKLGIVLEN